MTHINNVSAARRRWSSGTTASYFWPSPPSHAYIVPCNVQSRLARKSTSRTMYSKRPNYNGHTEQGNLEISHRGSDCIHIRLPPDTLHPLQICAHQTLHLMELQELQVIPEATAHLHVLFMQLILDTLSGQMPATCRLLVPPPLFCAEVRRVFPDIPHWDSGRSPRYCSQSRI